MPQWVRPMEGPGRTVWLVSGGFRSA